MEIKNVCNSVVKKISEYIKNNCITESLFCKTCNISKQTINRLKNGCNVRFVTLIKIAKTMEISLITLLG